MRIDAYAQAQDLHVPRDHIYGDDFTGRAEARPFSDLLLGALAVSATGLLDVAARALNLGAGAVRSPTYEYGTTYLLTAGLMNALLVLDAIDLALGRKP